MPTFSSNGVEIAYLDEPAPDPTAAPVLLIHGFASNAVTNWVDPGWVRHLTRQGHRVIALDNRGHGNSAMLYRPDEYRLPLMAEDARRLLAHLGIEQTHVMGYSMGARITAHLALGHRELVKTAIFGGLGINMVRGLAGAEPIAAALEAKTVEQVTDVTARTFRLFADQTRSDRLALAACIRGTREAIAVDVVGRIACPVLVAVGSADAIAGSGPELAALIPRAQALDIVGRDHMRAVGDRVYKDGVSAFLAAHR